MLKLLISNSHYFTKRLALALIVIAISLTWISCNDKFMERYPLTSMSGEAFFNSETDLRQYTNNFYGSILPGIGIYMDDANSDNMDPATVSELMMGSSRTIPASSTTAGWVWDNLRSINYFMEHYSNAKVTDAVKNRYAGVARFFRAWFYFDKVKSFGAVPWYSNTIGTNGSDLTKARDPRNVVVDSIVSDLDFAIQWLSSDKSDNSYVNKWAALAFKSRVCLYEGTWEKYHAGTAFGVSGSDGSTYLKLAASAAYDLITQSGYKLYNTGNPTSDYGNLFTLETADPGEVILKHAYDKTYSITHHANALFTSATLGNYGLTKDLVESYLTKGGLPYSTVANWNLLEFPAETQNRDPRLAQIIRTPGYKRRGGTTVLIPDFKNTLTGYQCIKFVTDASQDGNYANTNDLPILRLAEVMLNYAEAKTELGTLTADDVALSLNPIRARAGLPNFDLTNIPNDPILTSQYSHVSSPLILAIRRERRTELAVEGFRRDDLLRWNEGATLAKAFRGMYFSGFGTKDFNGDGIADFGIYAYNGQVSQVSGIQYFYLASSASAQPSFTLSNATSGTLNIHPSQTKSFNEDRDYLNPLPSTELLLNPNLTQNPGWGN